MDPGEREAIALAEQLNAELILLDEQTGRATAQARGLAFVGILGILGAEGGKWLFSEYDGLEAVLVCAALPFELALADLYEDVEFAKNLN